MFQGLSLRNVGFLGGLVQRQAYRYWRFKNLSFGSEGSGVSFSEWKIISDTVTSLVGKTITNLGGAFDPSYPITNINDGIVEVVNATNMGFVGTASGYFDVYVDLGAAVTVTGYQIAPQGTQNVFSVNNPTNFEAYGSNDASNWTLVATFNSISPNYPNWNAGTYRVFSF